MNFGEHEGRTFEWLFFNAPWYAKWIYTKGIHRQQNNFAEGDGWYFAELFTRATCLTGRCPQCKKNPITRMGLSTQQSGKLGTVGLFCDDCEYAGGSRTGYFTPSLIVDVYTPPRCEQRRITNHIKNHYIGRQTLTQQRMEQFFRTDAFFVNATPGFFTPEYARSMGYD